MAARRGASTGRARRRGSGAAEASPASVEEALARARHHGRAASAEALAAVRALLDAAALAASGEASQAHRLLGPMASLLEELRDRLAGGAEPDSAPLLGALAEALDAEIARWEKRARDDAEARAVLRAFLGIRELLWEFGVRNPARPGSGPAGARGDRAGAERGGPRVQRIRVQG